MGHRGKRLVALSVFKRGNINRNETSFKVGRKEVLTRDVFGDNSRSLIYNPLISFYSFNPLHLILSPNLFSSVFVNLFNRLRRCKCLLM